jgi:hypothetical protein
VWRRGRGKVADGRCGSRRRGRRYLLLRVFAGGAGFVRNGGIFGVKFAVGGDFLELEQALEGAAIDQVEAGFVAMDEVETAGIVGQGGESGGETFGIRGGGIEVVFEFLIEGGGFDGP